MLLNYVECSLAVTKQNEAAWTFYMGISLVWSRDGTKPSVS
ncbi:MAG: hypothetical protein ACI4FZ_12405 [Lachnospiraceae bacterium]